MGWFRNHLLRCDLCPRNQLSSRAGSGVDLNSSQGLACDSSQGFQWALEISDLSGCSCDWHLASTGQAPSWLTEPPWGWSGQEESSTSAPLSSVDRGLCRGATLCFCWTLLSPNLSDSWGRRVSTSSALVSVASPSQASSLGVTATLALLPAPLTLAQNCTTGARLPIILMKVKLEDCTRLDTC